MAYDILVKGGTLIDPGMGIHGLRDIGIENGRVVAISSEISSAEAKRLINAKGMIATPGLIDIHTHVAEVIMPLAVSPDEAGVLSGVTTICDAGSTGYANFNAFRKLIIRNSRTDVFCFLNLSPIGQVVMPEIGWENINPEEMLKIIEENRDIIKGIKLRAVAGVVERFGVEAVKTAKKTAKQANLPIAVHIGIGLEDTISDDKLDDFTPKMLAILDKGDILIHTFTHRKGGVIKPDGRVLPELREAIERGVVLDIATGSSHFSFELARMAMDQGIMPTTLSTDIVNTNINGPVVFSLPVIMSKFLGLGLKLDKVIEMTTVNPALALHESKERGTVRIGMPADISLFELAEGDFLFFDGKAGNTLQGRALLIPRLTIKSGIEIPTQSRFRNYIPGEQVSFPKGT